MDLLISTLTEFWGALAPTTWVVLGLLISFSFVKKLLF